MANKELIINSELDRGLKIRRLMAALAQEYRVASEAVITTYNLSILQLNILDVLSYALHGSLTVNRIIEALTDERPNVSRSLKKLETLGLVTKQRSNEDQRIVFVQVTKEGRQLRQQVKSQLPDHGINLSESESQILYELLLKI